MSDNFLLTPNKGATHRKKRLGAGPGSGRGSTCCRGHDGQRSRSGKKKPYVGFEGGQMPLYKRVPKRGFFHAKDKAIVLNIQDLNHFDATETLNIALLISKKLVKNPQTKLHILGNGELTKAINVEAHKISATALEKLNKAGGKVTLLKETVQ